MVTDYTSITPNVDDIKASLINEIVEYELAMFLSAPSAGGTSPCQEREATFRVMRRMTHSIHDTATLGSYLADLQAAHVDGRNLLTEKYARMDNLIPPLSESPLLDVIANAEMAFMVEATALYPHAVNVRCDASFLRYLRCELETLSDTTLEKYADTIHRAHETGRNLAVDRYEFLWRELGAGSLAEREASLAKRETSL